MVRPRSASLDACSLAARKSSRALPLPPAPGRGLVGRAAGALTPLREGAVAQVAACPPRADLGPPLRQRAETAGRRGRLPLLRTHGPQDRLARALGPALERDVP